MSWLIWCVLIVCGINRVLLKQTKLKMVLLTIIVLLVYIFSQGISQDEPACWTERNCDCCKSNPDDGTRDLEDICKNQRYVWACIYGCRDGYYGRKCYNVCPEYCTRCAREFGESVYPNDYQICYLCTDGYYNGTGITNCSTPCPANCAQNKCDKTSGNCLLGCISNNWSGEKCNVCADTWYGNNCEIPCPETCKDRICDSNGGCTNGCDDDNFTGSKCNQCRTGMHGGICEKSCPVNCKGDTCNRDDGVCTNGCKEDFNGDICDKCKPYYYGANCDKRCYSCLNGVCDQSTGRCIDCVSGMFGELCDKSCPTGCNNSICDRSSATCLQGCLFGLSGDECCVFSKGCEICDKDAGNCKSCKERKFYGDKCESQCPSNCHNGECLKEDGTCKSCEDKYYGKTCNMTCPDNCQNNMCGQYDGVCNNCSVGYYRRSCDYKCQSGCIGDTCTQDSGECTYGCENGNSCNHEPQSSCYTGEIIGGVVAGFIIITVLSHVLCIIWRRRQSRENNKDPTIQVNAIYENDKADPDGYEELQISNH